MDAEAKMAERCPVTHGFTAFGAGYVSDPYPFFNALRRGTPIAYSPNHNLYLVTRYDEIVAVFRNREVFSATNASEPFSPICGAARAILDSGFPRKPTFNNADPPGHTTIRRAAMKCLTRARWDATMPAVAAYIERCMARMRGKRIVDLGAELIFPTNSYAGFKLLGFPLADTEMLQGWYGKRLLLTYGILDEADQVLAAQQLVDFWGYCRDFVELRAREPDDDLTSDFIALDEVLELEDGVNMVYSLSLAAHETTSAAPN